MHFSSYTPWNIKTAWIKALYNKATYICSNQKLLDAQIKKTLSWNVSRIELFEIKFSYTFK